LFEVITGREQMVVTTLEELMKQKIKDLKKENQEILNTNGVLIAENDMLTSELKKRSDIGQSHNYPEQREQRSDIGQSHNYSDRPIKSAGYYARKMREDRKAYVEIVMHCEKNIIDLYKNMKNIIDMPVEAKRYIAKQMLYARDDFLTRYQQVDLEEYNQQLDQLLIEHGISRERGDE
jgi:regulator of replication initiation timing